MAGGQRSQEQAFLHGLAYPVGFGRLAVCGDQGTDYGRILVGLQVPPQDDKAFAKFLDTLGYPYAEETENPVYRLFF